MEEGVKTDTKFCTNCKRQINANNFMMHEMHCKRHISLCTHCQEPIPKAEMEVHFEENHANINCEKCGLAVQKMDLEKHEEQDCPKRPMKCAYCEMEVAQQDLESHLGYCGTRTEPCVKCGQYIMIKDQVKHQDSNCTYPTPKPTNGREANRQLSNGNGYTNNVEGSGAAFSDDLLFGTGDVNRFTFDELQRILAKPEVTGAAAEESVKRAPKREVESKKKGSQKVRSNDKNKKSDLNRLRERASGSQSAASANSEEHDRWLAMALSEDLQEENIGEYIRNIDKPRMSQTSHSDTSSLVYEDGYGNPANIHSSFGDLSMLPCEFCGQAIPVDDLVIHQSNCIEDPLSSLMPQAASSESRSQQENTDNRFRGMAPDSRQPPPIINNLVPDASAPQQQWFEQMITPEDEEFPEDILLPCEFCEDLFPHEILVQHQAVCAANSTVTPRVPTPAKRADPSKRQKAGDDQTSSRVRKRQPAPDITSILSESTDNRRNQSSTYSRKSSNDLVTPSQRLKSTLGKYGVSPDDTYQQRAERRAERQRSTLGHDSDEELVSPRPRTGKSTARKGVTTKSTLDNLLSDGSGPVRSSHDLLGHVTPMSSTRKSSKDNMNSVRQGRQPSTTSVSHTGARTSNTHNSSTSGLYGAPRTTPRGSVGDVGATSTRRSRGATTARDVQMEIDRLQDSSRSYANTSSITTGTRRTRNSRDSDDVTAITNRITSTTPGSARRDRGNRIFSHGQGASTSSRQTKTTSRRDRDPYFGP